MLYYIFFKSLLMVCCVWVPLSVQLLTFSTKLLLVAANIIMAVLMIRRSGTWHQCIVSHTTTCLWAKSLKEGLQMEHSGKQTITLCSQSISKLLCLSNNTSLLFVIQVSNLWGYARLELYKWRLLWVNTGNQRQQVAKSCWGTLAFINLSLCSCCWPFDNYSVLVVSSKYSFLSSGNTIRWVCSILLQAL
jgi:hypothetical protein